MLEQVAVMAAGTLGVDSSAGVTVIRDDQATTVASSDERSRDLDEIQYVHGDGPCLQAARTGATVTVPDASSETRWPQLMAAARRQGLRSSLSLALDLQGMGVGSLNVYAFERCDFDNGDEGSGLAELRVGASRRVALGLRIDEVVTHSDALDAVQANRKATNQAIGIIMAQNGCSADEAYAVLSRELLQSRGLRVRDYLAELVGQLSSAATSAVSDADPIPDPGPGRGERE